MKDMGTRVLTFSKKAYYNIYGEIPSNKTIVNYLFKNVSRYTVDMDEKYTSKPFKPKYMKEIIPEILGKNFTNPDEFTTEFVKLLKGAWNL